MIPIEALRAVRRCVVHANCPDGRAAAVILHAALPDAEIVEVAHDTAAHWAIEPASGVLFCDMVPWLPKIGDADPVGDEFHRKCLLSDWVESGTIVLDHHDGSEAIIRAFGQRGVFGRNSYEESGAWLAWRDVFCASSTIYTAEHQLALLASLRDTWSRAHPLWQEACELSEVLRMLPLDACLRRGAAGILATAADIGADLWAKKQDKAEAAATNAVRMTIGGHRIAIVPSRTIAEDAANIFGDEVDFVAGFDYVHEGGGVSMQWSLRSRGGVDVSVIARANGGNGHKAAAGFRVPLSDAKGVISRIDPYDVAAIYLSKGASA